MMTTKKKLEKLRDEGIVFSVNHDEEITVDVEKSELFVYSSHKQTYFQDGEHVTVIVLTEKEYIDREVKSLQSHYLETLEIQDFPQDEVLLSMRDKVRSFYKRAAKSVVVDELMTEDYFDKNCLTSTSRRSFDGLYLVVI